MVPIYQLMKQPSMLRDCDWPGYNGASAPEVSRRGGGGRSSMVAGEGVGQQLGAVWAIRRLSPQLAGQAVKF